MDTPKQDCRDQNPKSRHDKGFGRCVGTSVEDRVIRNKREQEEEEKDQEQQRFDGCERHKSNQKQTVIEISGLRSHEEWNRRECRIGEARGSLRNNREEVGAVEREGQADPAFADGLVGEDAVMDRAHFARR